MPLRGSALQRCKQLVIPPAWTDVWICPVENGHLQAVGTDEAGRRQYLYHPAWRLKRDREKFDYMLEFAAGLPRARKRVARDLAGESTDIVAVCALAFRLFDLGAFRIGSERYAEDNGSYGLLTLECRHIRRDESGMTFEYVAKAGKDRSLTTTDEGSRRVLERLLRRRATADRRLLAYKESGRWHDLNSDQVSAYLKQRLGEDATAKDFRTWQANVMAAACLSLSEDHTSHKKAVSEAMRDVADFLGNTPAVARSGYVDPRLLDLFEDGTTIESTIAQRHLPRPGKRPSPTLERAVRSLLAD